ncbi:putative MFS multidrug transporter [Aspergillus saccharolyticus JOP 1030-1]|uniref:MFS multidrug transporter n=1 Tax=Aspergillus saccharolyticus JOP 1030-1 TaxID=1450539 RepID=A0A318ZEH4_9EURO|nr:MFS multidrug transporter [Aspergillus saccharolyticus JOP 1030-1]PYH45951.1 MFS multidrug transporter [Aspergillus saccharolyticus JOP 1030-1]
MKPTSQITMSSIESEKDVLQSLLPQYGLRMAADGVHIRWAVSNSRHPRNWRLRRKLWDTALVLFLEFFTTAVSTAGSIAANSAVREFQIPQELSIFLFVSVYLVGQACGGIIFPPYSEAFGRKKLYVVSAALYSLSCVVVASVPSVAGVILGRLMSGVLSAIPTTVVGGSIEDLFNSRERVWMICIWVQAANLGMVVGPILSTFVVADLDWRWLFYVAAMVTGVLALLLLTIRESRPSLLLAREVALFRQVTQIPDTPEALNPDQAPDLHAFVRLALFRPIRLLCTEPIVFIVAVMSAVAIALVYLFTQALPPIYESFGFSPRHACLPFIAIGLGLFLGCLTRWLDLRIIAQHRSQGGALQPEDKLLGFWIGTPVLAAALWVFAWTIPPAMAQIPWIVSVVALVLTGFSLNEIDYVLGGYLTDSYLSYAASGLAALSLVRAMLSAVLPLVSAPMLQRLGANGAVSVLAAIATVFCLVPPLFARYGRALRARSAFASYSMIMYREWGVDEEGY